MSEANEVDEQNEDQLDEGWDDDDDDDIDDGEGASADDDGEGLPGDSAEATDDGGPARKKRRRRKRSDNGSPFTLDDERGKRAYDFLVVLLQKMQMDCTVRARRPRPEAEGEISLEILGHDAGRVIGKKGQVLAAIQFLANRVTNRPGEERRYVTVDAEGYQSRRDSSLASMARRLGKQAVTEGKIITFEPMNPRDRRVVHLALAKFDGVVTKSEGEGDQRRVQIIPVRR